jgi:hypothetical protein
MAVMLPRGNEGNPTYEATPLRMKNLWSKENNTEAEVVEHI